MGKYGQKNKTWRKRNTNYLSYEKKYTTKIEGQKALLEYGKEKQEEKNVEYLTKIKVA